MIRTTSALAVSCCLISAVLQADDSGHSERSGGSGSPIDRLARGGKVPRTVESHPKDPIAPEPGGASLWTRYHFSELDDDRPVNAKEAEANAYLVGIDYPLSPNTLVGAGYIEQRTDLVSAPSPPPVSAFSEVEYESRGVLLHGIHTLPSGLGLDGHFSYRATDTAITDFAAIAPRPTTKFTEGDDFVMGFGANLVQRFDPDRVQGVLRRIRARYRLSYTHSWGDRDAHTDIFGRAHAAQEYEVGTFGLHSEFHYPISDAVSAYAGVYFGYDAVSEVASPAPVRNPGGTLATVVPFQRDREPFAYGYQAGVAVELAPSLTLDGGYEQRNWGDSLQVDSVSVGLRFSF